MNIFFYCHYLGLSRRIFSSLVLKNEVMQCLTEHNRCGGAIGCAVDCYSCCSLVVCFTSFLCWLFFLMAIVCVDL